MFPDENGAWREHLCVGTHPGAPSGAVEHCRTLLLLLLQAEVWRASFPPFRFKLVRLPNETRRSVLTARRFLSNSSTLSQSGRIEREREKERKKELGKQNERMCVDEGENTTQNTRTRSHLEREHERKGPKERAREK